jgi:ketosteroid isomerase-like protein
MSSVRKQVVETYIEGFRTGDREAILACLTDDVTWEMAPHFNLSGIEAFAGEIQNPATPGLPDLEITRLVEEGDIVVCEGSVQADLAAGGRVDALFCDVFHFRGDRICGLTTYQVDRSA